MIIANGKRKNLIERKILNSLEFIRRTYAIQTRGACEECTEILSQLFLVDREVFFSRDNFELQIQVLRLNRRGLF